jgi:hypothetical protein
MCTWKRNFLLFKLKFLWLCLAGIDPLLWRQAKLDNPDTNRLVPVAMVGFRELQRRLKHQAEETRLHQQRLDVSQFTVLLFFLVIFYVDTLLYSFF